VLTLRTLVGEQTLEELGVPAAPSRIGEVIVPFPSDLEAATGERHGIRRAGNLSPEEARDRAAAAAVQAPPAREPAPEIEAPPVEQGSTLVFDLETQLSAEDVGGWGNCSKMRMALGVVYDVRRKAYRTYFEADVDRLLLDLVMADRVVGFNLDRFDLDVLSAYTEWDLKKIRTLDLLNEIHRRLGFRVSLAHLCEVNLGESKSASGLQSLVWWREGRIDLIEQYCKKDVELTRKIYDLGRRDGYLLYRDHDERTVRVPVDW